jgi:uncharacterized protein
MSSKTVKLLVSPTIGEVSGQYIVPKNAACIITLAHGAGAGMNHAFMIALAEALSDEGIASLRFNFPFAENNKKRPDFPAVAHKTIETAINHATESHPSLPLFASGKSFGGRMSSQYLAAHPGTAVKGIIFYGFPLHPAGKPSTDRADHLKQVDIPMLFLQGTRDTLAQIDMIESVCSSLPQATLVKLEGADHSFKAGKQDLIPVLARHTREWMSSSKFKV